MASMMVSIDGAGRVVVPKGLRDALGLDAGAELEVEVVGDGLRLTPMRPRPRRVVEVDGWPVIEAGSGRVTTDADVQRWRDAGQR
jgi:AbrB family looped-hinge helix DNA binding protein